MPLRQKRTTGGYHEREHYTGRPASFYGYGLAHSEYNKAGRDLHFYQIWVLPDKAGLPPSYEQKEFTENDFRNVLFPLASGQNHAGAVRFHTDAAIYRSRLDTHRKLELRTAPERKLLKRRKL